MSAHPTYSTPLVVLQCNTPFAITSHSLSFHLKNTQSVLGDTNSLQDNIGMLIVDAPDI